MLKKGLFFLTFFSIAAVIAVFYGISKSELVNIKSYIEGAGLWAPVIYMAVYMAATALVLPSTALNLAGGALFGVFWGVIWTSLAALISAIIIFWVTRTLARKLVQHRLNSRWKDLDTEFRAGGPFYILAVRLLPVIPYGIVNYSAGLSHLSFRDYLIGTCLGTVPGLLPFVMLGSSGVKVVETGQVLPIVLPLTLIGVLVAFTTWYKTHRQAALRNKGTSDRK